MATLERAIAIAAKAREGQVDKAGAPYILHPLRVMLHAATIEERIATQAYQLRVAMNGVGFATEVP